MVGKEWILMFFLKLPYFMKKDDWYYFGDDDKYHLTEKAPPKAVKSYEKFAKTNYTIDKNGDEWIPC